MLLTFDTLVSFSFFSARTITRTSGDRLNPHLRQSDNEMFTSLMHIVPFLINYYGFLY